MGTFISLIKTLKKEEGEGEEEEQEKEEKNFSSK